MITIEQATRVIGVMQQTFNAMNFIRVYRDLYWAEYQDELIKYRDTSMDDPIQIFHQRIGRFLTNNSMVLNIRRIGDCKTTNTKGFEESEVSEWEKK